uniref:Uncharacterized protein n=1 Tax=Setaria italica TaxID=4555 RepID=K3XKV8_SETIT
MTHARTARTSLTSPCCSASFLCSTARACAYMVNGRWSRSDGGGGGPAGSLRDRAAGNCSTRQGRAPCVPGREGAPPSMPASRDCMPPHLNSPVNVHPGENEMRPLKKTHARKFSKETHKTRNACEKIGSYHYICTAMKFMLWVHHIASTPYVARKPLTWPQIFIALQRIYMCVYQIMNTQVHPLIRPLPNSSTTLLQFLAIYRPKRSGKKMGIQKQATTKGRNAQEATEAYVAIESSGKLKSCDAETIIKQDLQVYCTHQVVFGAAALLPPA